MRLCSFTSELYEKKKKINGQISNKAREKQILESDSGILSIKHRNDCQKAVKICTNTQYKGQKIGYKFKKFAPQNYQPVPFC